MSASHLTLTSLERFVDELIAAWNSHDVERVVALYAPHYEGIDVAESQPQRGRDAIRQSIVRYVSAFPDLHLHAEHIVVQANRIALSWVAHGTHQGALLNIPPTGRDIAVRGMSFLLVEDGQVVQAQNIWDLAGLLRGMGLLPEL